MTLSFAELGVAEPLTLALADAGHTTPTPIQAQAIPPLLDGRDVLGIAQTGTGKTAAFLLPIMSRLLAEPKPNPKRGAKVLVLAPTRELAQQISDAFKLYAQKHTRLWQAVIVGGVPQSRQERAMARGVDLLVATPGRLLDLVDQGAVRLDAVETLVLDEADRMLDMGFAPAMKRIAALIRAEQRHTILFSATMPKAVDALAAELLNEPVRCEIKAETISVERIEQQVHMVPQAKKRAFLTDLLANPALARVILFTRTKHGADRVCEHLERGGIDAEAIHGNKAQGARQRALKRFRAGEARVLVATDIAARGIDVPGVTHVINFDLPVEVETYVHRIGRTARAGCEGIAISLCDPAETKQLEAIRRYVERKGEPEPVRHARSGGPRRGQGRPAGHAKPGGKPWKAGERDGRRPQRQPRRGDRAAVI
ncbi:MAG: DEAD/DEAH box helicase [Pseudomonadota bacterium]